MGRGNSGEQPRVGPIAIGDVGGGGATVLPNEGEPGGLRVGSWSIGDADESGAGDAGDGGAVGGSGADDLGLAGYGTGLKWAEDLVGAGACCCAATAAPRKKKGGKEDGKKGGAKNGKEGGAAVHALIVGENHAAHAILNSRLPVENILPLSYNESCVGS